MLSLRSLGAVIGLAFLMVMVLLVLPGPAFAQESCPPANCTYGKDVGRDFYVSVVQRLKDVPYNDFAVDALMAWAPHENTRACWNPLATTWKMNPVCYFNCLRRDTAGNCTSGVQNFQGQDLGVRATANTLNQGYYDAIRRMLRLESFDRDAVGKAMATWGTCRGTGCNALFDKWQALWNRYSGQSSKQYTITGPSGYTLCATENTRCNFSGVKDVAYGTDGRYFYRQGVSGGIDCNNGVFGDPAVGLQKGCFIRDAAGSGGNSGGRSCDDSEGVYLYEHSNYMGRCHKVTGDMSNPRSWSVGNDSASSIRIIGDWIATLYEHDDYQGSSSSYRFSDPWLGDDAVGNDRASSIRVQRGSMSSAGNCTGDGVYLYEHTNYMGRCYKATADMSNPRSWSIGNDSVSSIRIVGNWAATLFEHDNYQGASTTYWNSDPYLPDDEVGNDRASSIRVWRR